MTATYLINKSLIRLLKRDIMPYKVFKRLKPLVLYIHVFDYTAYGKIPS